MRGFLSVIMLHCVQTLESRYPMKYSREEVLQYVQEDDVKFIRLAFCDVFGHQKNISINPTELPRAFEKGIVIDGSAIKGFGSDTHSDLLLHPEAETLHQLPWRPEHGKVVRLYTDITYPDGTPFPCDTRRLLKQAVADAKKAGFRFFFGAKQEFYLFLLDDNGYPTTIPYDHAGYMDLAPEDRGENIRREICLTLEQMGIQPESSHHEEGPGQNRINFRYSEALSAADNVMTFRNVVKTIAHRNGLCADFHAKPLADQPGNGFHIIISAESDDGSGSLPCIISGILEKAYEMTAFLNPTSNSYTRFGRQKAPGYISWSDENRSQFIRIPASDGDNPRADLRSPDPTANPYLVYALLIYAGLYGIKNKLILPSAAEINLNTADPDLLKNYQKLPEDLISACKAASASSFIQTYIPQEIISIYCSERSN